MDTTSKLRVVRATRIKTKADSAVDACSSLLGSLGFAHDVSDTEAEANLTAELVADAEKAQRLLRSIEERIDPYKADAK